MTITALYYLGPENTFSHTAAQRIQADHPHLQHSSLIPSPSADDLFRQVQTNPHAGAIVPVFNLEQGVVHDFARFYLFEPVAEEKLSVTFAMFSQATSLGDVRKLITKDTVIPQISRWVDQLPPHIEIEATPHISTAASALRASREPHTAAICSPQAGAAYPDLHLLDDQLSNDPDSYTQFKLFVRPDDYWHDTGLFPTPEYPYLLNNELAAQLRAGDCLIGWRKSTKSALHLGHYSNLLTLRKLASWGNKIKIMLDGPTTDRTDSIYAALTDFFGDALAVTYERGSAVSPHAPSVDLVVAGIEHIHTLSQRPAIFIDSVPGTDGYAQMATARGNTRSWLAPTCLDELPSLFHPHFSPKRMLSAQLSA